MTYEIGQATVRRPANVTGRTVPSKARGPTFEQVLRQAEQKRRPGPERVLKFSAHAVERMRMHGIRIDEALKQKLQAGLDMARSKGIQDSLVVTDRVNFIVNVPNCAVITMMPRGAPQGDVFTNIDGAVIV